MVADGGLSQWDVLARHNILTCNYSFQAMSLLYDLKQITYLSELVSWYVKYDNHIFQPNF